MFTYFISILRHDISRWYARTRDSAEHDRRCVTCRLCIRYALLYADKNLSHLYICAIDLLTTPPGFAEGMTFGDQISPDSTPLLMVPSADGQTVNISELLFGGRVLLEWAEQLEDKDENVQEREEVSLFVKSRLS